MFGIQFLFELRDLFLVKEQASVVRWVVLFQVPCMSVGGDVCVFEPRLSITDLHERSREFGAPRFCRFHFLSGQHNTGLEGIEDFKVIACTFVGSEAWHTAALYQIIPTISSCTGKTCYNRIRDMKKLHPTTISITTGTMIKFLAVLGGLWFLWFIRDVVAIFFVALLLAALIEPFAAWLHKRHVPRGFGVLIVYVILFALIAGIIWLVVPPFVEQIQALGGGIVDVAGSARGAFDQILAFTEQYGLADNINSSVASYQEGITSAITHAFSTITGIFGGIAALILVLVLAFYMVVEENAAKRLFRHVTPKKYRPYISGLIGRMQDKLGAWLRGQIILMIVVGIMTYIGLLIIGVEYPLVLAVFAGIAEIVPYAGPIIAAVPAIVIAFTASPIKALIVVALYIGIQQLENSVLTPKIMQKSVGLNPVVSLFVLLVGFQLAGLVGALLAIPVATMLAVFIKDLIGEDEELKKVTKHSV